MTRKKPDEHPSTKIFLQPAGFSAVPLPASPRFEETKSRNMPDGSYTCIGRGPPPLSINSRGISGVGSDNLVYFRATPKNSCIGPPEHSSLISFIFAPPLRYFCCLFYREHMKMSQRAGFGKAPQQAFLRAQVRQNFGVWPYPNCLL